MYNINEVRELEGYIIIVLIFGIILLGTLIILYFVNQILRYRMVIDNSFIAVRVSIDKMEVLIDNISEFIRVDLSHEISLKRNFDRLKELVRTIENDKNGIEKIKVIEKELLSFIELENNYKNLTKNKEYIRIKEEILNNKDRLIYAFDGYDKGVNSYNIYRRKKLINFLSKLCRIPLYDNYNK